MNLFAKLCYFEPILAEIAQVTSNSGPAALCSDLMIFAPWSQPAFQSSSLGQRHLGAAVHDRQRVARIVLSSPSNCEAHSTGEVVAVVGDQVSYQLRNLIEVSSRQANGSGGMPSARAIG